MHHISLQYVLTDLYLVQAKISTFIHPDTAVCENFHDGQRQLSGSLLRPLELQEDPSVSRQNILDGNLVRNLMSDHMRADPHHIDWNSRSFQMHSKTTGIWSANDGQPKIIWDQHEFWLANSSPIEHPSRQCNTDTWHNIHRDASLTVASQDQHTLYPQFDHQDSLQRYEPQRHTETIRKNASMRAPCQTNQNSRIPQPREYCPTQHEDRRLSVPVKNLQPQNQIIRNPLSGKFCTNQYKEKRLAVPVNSVYGPNFLDTESEQQLESKRRYIIERLEAQEAFLQQMDVCHQMPGNQFPHKSAMMEARRNVSNSLLDMGPQKQYQASRPLHQNKFSSFDSEHADRNFGSQALDAFKKCHSAALASKSNNGQQLACRSSERLLDGGSKYLPVSNSYCEKKLSSPLSPEQRRNLYKLLHNFEHQEHERSIKYQRMCPDLTPQKMPKEFERQIEIRQSENPRLTAKEQCQKFKPPVYEFATVKQTSPNVRGQIFKKQGNTISKVSIDKKSHAKPKKKISPDSIREKIQELRPSAKISKSKKSLAKIGKSPERPIRRKIAEIQESKAVSGANEVIPTWKQHKPRTPTRSPSGSNSIEALPSWETRKPRSACTSPSQSETIEPPAQWNSQKPRSPRKVCSKSLQSKLSSKHCIHISGVGIKLYEHS